jgi:hypothetical protein
MVDLDNYDDAVIMKAFWLQRHIHKYGIEGIHFMAEAEREAEKGDEQVAKDIARRLQKL